jgi:hypothetical protein
MCGRARAARFIGQIRTCRRASSDSSSRKRTSAPISKVFLVALANFRSTSRKDQPMRFALAVAMSGWLVVAPALADEPVSTSTPQGCVPYTIQIVLQGVPREAVGHACPQADGGWRVLQDAVIPATPTQGTSQSPLACRERIENCERSCDVNGILGARHVHPDCSVTCDMICGRREGYAPWEKTEKPDR